MVDRCKITPKPITPFHFLAIHTAIVDMPQNNIDVTTPKTNALSGARLNVLLNHTLKTKAATNANNQQQNNFSKNFIFL